MRAVGVVGRCDNSSGGWRVGGVWSHKCAWIFSSEMSRLAKKPLPQRLKEGKSDHECEDQTLCDLERWVREVG